MSTLTNKHKNTHLIPILTILIHSISVVNFIIWKCLTHIFQSEFPQQLKFLHGAFNQIINLELVVFIFHLIGLISAFSSIFFLFNIVILFYKTLSALLIFHALFFSYKDSPNFIKKWIARGESFEGRRLLLFQEVYRNISKDNSDTESNEIEKNTAGKDDFYFIDTKESLVGFLNSLKPEDQMKRRQLLGLFVMSNKLFKDSAEGEGSKKEAEEAIESNEKIAFSEFLKGAYSDKNIEEMYIKTFEKFNHNAKGFKFVTIPLIWYVSIFNVILILLNLFMFLARYAELKDVELKLVSDDIYSNLSLSLDMSS